MKQNYPKPFNPVTNIEFDLPFTNHTRLRIYNSMGQEVATLVNEELPAGSYKYSFNAEKLPSGVYLYKLESGGFVETKKMTLVK
ncbi:MAG: T9SS type A sorting domain-containing protein [Ignavibacteria bacterium]|nr:T9SS type A sorting domain-containing protein [Ignavibacteria bacterium]